MDIVLWCWDFLVHIDAHLAQLLQQYGAWMYVILFAIVFCETGLVITPFLPGDSLLFIAGALWASAGMDIHALMLALVVAAILGDALNYAVGRTLGPRVFQWEQSRWFNRRALDHTHAFYLRHGGKTIIIARFVPLVRTFAPFVAGIGAMPYRRFLVFNVVGALIWVALLLYAGYFFGNLPAVKRHLSVVIFGIIGVSLLPIVVSTWRARRRGA